MPNITDIWFRTDWPLEELGDRLGLEHINYGAENVWEWITGTFVRYHLDITRTHLVQPAETDTRIFLLGSSRIFPDRLMRNLIPRLQKVAISPIYLGRWNYVSGDDFEQVVLQTIEKP